MSISPDWTAASARLLDTGDAIATSRMRISRLTTPSRSVNPEFLGPASAMRGALYLWGQRSGSARQGGPGAGVRVPLAAIEWLFCAELCL